MEHILVCVCVCVCVCERKREREREREREISFRGKCGAWREEREQASDGGVSKHQRIERGLEEREGERLTTGESVREMPSLDCEAFVPVAAAKQASAGDATDWGDAAGGAGEIAVRMSGTTSRDVADSMLTAYDMDSYCKLAREVFFERGSGRKTNPIDDFFANTFILDSPVVGDRRARVTCPNAFTASELQDRSEVDLLCRCAQAPLMYRIYVTEQVCEGYKTATQVQVQGNSRATGLAQFQADRASILACEYGAALRSWCMASGHPVFAANLTGIAPSREDFRGDYPIPPAKDNLARADFEDPLEFVQYQCTRWCEDNCSRWPKNVCGLDESSSSGMSPANPFVRSPVNTTCTCKYSATLIPILIVPFAIALMLVLMALYGSCGPGRRRLENRLGRFKDFEEKLEAVKNPICEL